MVQNIARNPKNAATRDDAGGTGELQAASAHDWGPSYFAPHNWWHFGLYNLELCREAEAAALYDGPLTELGLANPLYQVDAASLLWRLSLQGTRLATQADELADAFEATLGDSTYCFNDWHAVMALSLAAICRPCWPLSGAAGRVRPASGVPASGGLERVWAARLASRMAWA